MPDTGGTRTNENTILWVQEVYKLPSSRRKLTWRNLQNQMNGGDGREKEKEGWHERYLIIKEKALILENVPDKNSFKIKDR